MKLKGYKVSNDYTKLKEFLDKDYKVIILWVHSGTQRLFSGIAEKVPPIPGGVEGNWYSLDIWSYFPTIDRDSFEKKCKSIGFSYIEPE